MILLIDATATDDLGQMASASVAVTVNLPAADILPPDDPFNAHLSNVLWKGSVL